MRMWLVDPRYMCRNHLMGEHAEIHMFIGHMKLKRSVSGYLNDNLLEPFSLYKRHEELVQEMLRRKYNHNSPTAIPKDFWDYLTFEEMETNIDRDSAMVELFQRCPECRKRFHEEAHGESFEYYFEKDMDQILEIEYRREMVRDYNKKVKDNKRKNSIKSFFMTSSKTENRKANREVKNIKNMAKNERIIDTSDLII